MRHFNIVNQVLGVCCGWLLLPLLTACAVENDTADDENDPSCGEPANTFRIVSIASPADAEVGVDLDRDGAIDDRAGDLIRTFFHTYASQEVEEAWQSQIDARLADRTAWYLSVPGCERGRVLDATLPDGLPLGALADFTGEAGDGWHGIEPLAIDVNVDGTELEGTIAGGLAPGYQEVIAESLIPFLNGLLAVDASPWAEQLDTDGDGVEVSEILASSAFKIFTAPDLDTDGDGEPDALSFAISVRAGYGVVE